MRRQSSLIRAMVSAVSGFRLCALGLGTDSFSALAYHLAIATGCGFESSRPAYVYSRAQVDAGKNYKVGFVPVFCLRVTMLIWMYPSFMAHPETLLPMSTIDDPVERFVSVVKFYLSGWHIKPAYVYPGAIWLPCYVEKVF